MQHLSHADDVNTVIITIFCMQQILRIAHQMPCPRTEQAFSVTPHVGYGCCSYHRQAVQGPLAIRQKWRTRFGLPWPLLSSLVACPLLLCFTSPLLCFRAGLQHLHLFKSSEASCYCDQMMYRIHRIKLETAIVLLTDIEVAVSLSCACKHIRTPQDYITVLLSGTKNLQCL